MCDPTYNRLTPPNLLTRLARPQGPQEAGGQLGDQPQPSLRCSLSHMWTTCRRFDPVWFLKELYQSQSQLKCFLEESVVLKSRVPW